VGHLELLRRLSHVALGSFQGDKDERAFEGAAPRPQPLSFDGLVKVIPQDLIDEAERPSLVRLG
jgi:hypothetical protein